ncbi:YgaP-like transmembrane domain [Streptomyces sp. NPDC046862]|uniref:rhodanese-like domain-containing protein n=1 Tax=Streptomyces sp. NPDC046862 TaxID=3154603 RepID=UPI0034573403
MTSPIALDVIEARAQLSQLTVIDIRTPAEYASGPLPGALNIPLDELHRPEAAARALRGMERRVRFTAGVIVLLGLGLGAVVPPAFQLLAAAVAGGLACSALSDTCGMAFVLGRLPFNRPRGADLESALAHCASAERRG